MTRPRIGTVFLPDLGARAAARRSRAPPRTPASTTCGSGRTASRSPARRPPPRRSRAPSASRVGIGLMPAPLRNVATAAMEIATLERLFPGRFVPVVGHGVQDWMGQIGARAESPLTLLREYADGTAPPARRRDGHRRRAVRAPRRRAAQWPPAAAVAPAASAARVRRRWRSRRARRRHDVHLRARRAADRRQRRHGARAATGGRPHEIIAHLMVTRGADARRAARRRAARLGPHLARRRHRRDRSRGGRRRRSTGSPRSASRRCSSTASRAEPDPVGLHRVDRRARSRRW